MTFAHHLPSRLKASAIALATVTVVACAAVPAQAAEQPTAGTPVGSSEFFPAQIQDTMRGMVNSFFPGLMPEATPEPEPAPAPEPEPQPEPEVQPEPEKPAFDTSKCPKTARACIDLDKEVTWLQKDGVITYGPVKESAGAPYPATATPKGVHYVNRKVKDEISRPHNNAPMPYSVYFTNNGIAFHQGDVNLWSHGCIHLNRADAIHYFNTLKIGDMVYVY